MYKRLQWKTGLEEEGEQENKEHKEEEEQKQGQEESRRNTPSYQLISMPLLPRQAAGMGHT